MKLKEDTLITETYEEVIREVNEKVGKMPKKPTDLPLGDWSAQAIKVLTERYLDKNHEGEVIENPDELIWRVAFSMN